MRGFIDFLLRQPITIAVGTLLAVFTGVLAITHVPVRMTPEVSSIVIAVTTNWENASTEEIESDIVEEQEKVLGEITGFSSMTSTSAATHGMVGMLATAGTLSQIGIDHMRVRDDFGAPVFEQEVLPFFRAASARARLHGRVMGLFGGRSLGIDTGTFDPMQWRAQFGVDVTHIDRARHGLTVVSHV